MGTQDFLASTTFFALQEDSCSVVFLGKQTFQILQVHWIGESPLGCKVSRVVHILLFIGTGYKWYVHCHWDFE